MGACLVGLVAVTGCSGVGKLHPVSGKVTGDFKEGDVVVFSKAGAAKGTGHLDIQGVIKGDGSYTMKTSVAKSLKDGVPEGTYSVSITQTPPSTGAAGDPGGMAAGGAGGGPQAAPPLGSPLKVTPDEVKVPGGSYDLAASK